MSGTSTRDITDAELVAFHDRELDEMDRLEIARALKHDARLQARLALLSKGERPFREAFDGLLAQAPTSALEARLETLLATSARPAPPMFVSRLLAWQRSRIAMLAAALLLVLAGAGADRAYLAGARPIAPVAAVLESPDDWRQAVAEYLTLYSTDAVATIPDTADMRAQELAAVSAKVGLELSPEKVSLPALPLKRAQLLDYEGHALAQLTYLDPQAGPIALCVIVDGAAEATPHVEQRVRRNVVHWSHEGRSFMVIGTTSSPRLQDIALRLRLQLETL